MNPKQKSRVSVIALGLRGIPNVPGGVEVHASELYPRMQALGANIVVIGRDRHRPSGSSERWRGVTVRWIPSPRIACLEAVVHTFLGVLYAAVHRPDVLHIHAVGPWLMVPLAKLFGLKVVITHHGEDYLREKWGTSARAILRLGERLGMTFADECIVISNPLLALMRSKYARTATLIPNGISEPEPNPSPALTEKYGLTARRYVIQVSRLVPEKRQLDLIAAFDAAALPGWKLLLVGGAQGSQHYAEQVRARIAGNEAIVSTGFLTPREIQSLLANAGIFALPSSHEGLPIALMEAMKCGAPVVASDIPANREMRLDEECYFPVGDTHALAQRLRELSAMSPVAREQNARRLIALCDRFDWDVIAESTMKVMARAVGRPYSRPLVEVPAVTGSRGADGPTARS
jgi:glycosyltransferase involved in cell wall biosynthesis